jgi:hypothetical protein
MTTARDPSSLNDLAALPLTGIYHASKWALEGFSETDDR